MPVKKKEVCVKEKSGANKKERSDDKRKKRDRGERCDDDG